MNILEIDGVPVPREEPELISTSKAEAARILGWVRGPKDIENEFEVSEKEAAELWSKPSLVMLGPGDVPLLEFKEGA